MAERHPRAIELSPEAMLAAERLAEIAGLQAADLLEVVLLELAESGTAMGPLLARNRPNPKSSRPRAPAEVIPIDRARERTGRPSRSRSSRRPHPGTTPEPAQDAGRTVRAVARPPEIEG